MTREEAVKFCKKLRTEGNPLDRTYEPTDWEIELVTEMFEKNQVTIAQKDVQIKALEAAYETRQTQCLNYLLENQKLKDKIESLEEDLAQAGFNEMMYENRIDELKKFIKEADEQYGLAGVNEVLEKEDE